MLWWPVQGLKQQGLITSVDDVVLGSCGHNRRAVLFDDRAVAVSVLQSYAL